MNKNPLPCACPELPKATAQRPRVAPFGNNSAFTLIELLTVIAIIIILMGILFPAVMAVKEGARRTQAKNDAGQIVAAVKQYFTEYGKYPPFEATTSSSSSATTDDFVGDTQGGASPSKGSNANLFDTLRAISRGVNADHKLNPRRIVFFEGKTVSNPDQPRGGFLDKTGTGSSAATLGAYFDPWGRQYFVMVDSNYDNVLDMGQVYTDFSSADDKPRTGVGVFSLGKDSVVGDEKGVKGAYRSGQKVSDDIISWQ